MYIHTLFHSYFNSFFANIQQVWNTIGYGIPCLAASDDTLTISISSLENGDSLFEFNLTGPEKYKVLDKHFHVFISGLDLGCHLTEQQSPYYAYGLSFAHEKVAERFHQAVMQLVPQASESLTSSEATNSKRDKPQRMHVLSKSLNVSPEEMTDFPPFQSSSEYTTKSKLSVEEAGALTSSGKFPTPLEESAEDEQSLHVLQATYNGATSEEEIIEDVDTDGRISIQKKRQTGGKKNRLHVPSRLINRRGSLEGNTEKKQFPLKKRSESLQDVRISYPTTVKHLAHIDQETPFHTLKQIVNTGSAPGSVFEESIDRKRYSRLQRSPSAPCHVRPRSKSLLKSFRPAILVTPAKTARKKKLSPKLDLPSPPAPISDFESFLQQLQSSKEQSQQISDNQSELTSSLDTWQLSFHSAVGNLIRKKLQSDTIYSKLLSFTQSGKQETCEKPSSRTTSVIIHDHGMVCL